MSGQVSTDVIVVNGGSSSGQSGIVRCLKAILPQPWLNIGVDDLVDRLPPALLGSGSGISFGPAGMVALQAETVHNGVRYDIEVDTTRTEALDCARTIAQHVS